MMEESGIRNSITDYIYLIRVEKFSKSGLIKLFKNPDMDISHIQKLNKENISKLLLKKSTNIKLTDYQKIDSLFQLTKNDENYNEINEMVKYCNDHDINIITPQSKNIPRIFKPIKVNYRDLIFYKGEILDSDYFSYSICGTRNPTQDGIYKTRAIAKFLSSKGLTLINGFAKGIDIEAYIGAKSVNGRYIGVLASGVENIYSPENRKYVSEILLNGALISQRLLKDRVNRYSLQMRNRFSAQLSLGSIFIEGNYKSGTKWQFKFAREFGLPTFYLEPKNWSHENSYIPKLIKDEGGIQIRNDLSNLDEIYQILITNNTSRQKVTQIEKNAI